MACRRCIHILGNLDNLLSLSCDNMWEHMCVYAHIYTPLCLSSHSLRIFIMDVKFIQTLCKFKSSDLLCGFTFIDFSTSDQNCSLT